MLLILLAAFVVFLFFGYRIVKDKAIYYLSSPIDIGSAIIIPQGFETDFPFKFSWESVKVKFMQGSDLTFKNPKISFDPKLTTRRELLNISIDSVHAKIIPSAGTTGSTEIEHMSHPDLWLPFRVSINVNKAAVEVKDIGNWNLDSLVAAKSGRQKRVYIRAKNIKGTHLAKKLFLNAEYRWNESFVDAALSISDRANDSLAFILNAPRLHLEDLSADINANVANLPFWLKDKWPKDAPIIENIAIHSNASVNILTGKAYFDLSLKTKTGKIWQLPAFDVTITALGNNSGISQSEILLKGANGESVQFKGNIDKNLDGSGELEAKGINITLGPQTLPTDVKIHRITKKGNSASANFTTGAGSNFTARVADLNNPIIIFSADLAPKEPWAVQWCGDMLKLANPTVLTGSFSFKEILLKANLKTKVPYAYHTTVDEFEVSLWLNKSGIHFPKGTIKRKGYKSEFTGEVIWDKEYFTFKLEQPSGGEAEVYGTFSPKIDLTLKNINTLELPFADTSMLRGYNGFVTGTWNHDFEEKNGKASVSLSTVIRDFAVNGKADIEMLGDSLIAKNIEIEHNKKRVEGYLFALLPSEARKEMEIKKANLNIADMNLVSLLAMFNDSTLSSGFANGNLEFNEKTGLRGEIIFTQIALTGLDPGIARFPNLYLEANGDSVKISNRVFLGYDGLWDGALKAVLSKPKEKSDLPFRVSYAASNIDNKGELVFDGFISKDFKSIFGNAQVQGDWFLPSGMGEIRKTDINITAKAALGKNILDSLTAVFNTGQNIYKAGIFEIPFALNGRVRRGTLFVDSAFVYGQNDEKITAALQFDLKKANIRDLSFNTKQFTLSFLNDHLIQIKNGTGRTALDSAGITVFADLPAIFYRMENTNYGKAGATLKGRAVYRLPFQTSQSQTNPSITGNFEISRATYQKDFELIPDPLQIDKTLKNINKFLVSLVREKRVSSNERNALTGRPTTLDIKIQTGSEAALVNTSVAEFAFVVDVAVTGTTRNILLAGDINAIGGGKIGHKDLTMFDLSSLRLYWRTSPVKQGEIDLSFSNDYPFCVDDEKCKISVNVTGPLAKLNMEPTASCDIEASPALIYYSMLLGCISRDYESGVSIDRDRAFGKLVGKTMSSTINRVVGGNMVGDIDFKWKWLNEASQEEDTNYVRIPIDLSKWVENLEFVLGFTSTGDNNNNPNPSYDKSYEIGFRYKLPVFDSTDTNRNLIEPSLNIETNLVARQYILTDDATDETRLEKNVGLIYSHKFWDPCILGIGYCKMAGH